MKMKVKNRSLILIILCVAIFSSGCSMIPMQTKPVQVKTIAEPLPIYHPPLPMELQLVDVDWVVLNPELMQEYLNEQENGSAPRKAYYSLTSKEYENLSMNMADLKRYLRDILAINEYYRQYGRPEEEDEELPKKQK